TATQVGTRESARRCRRLDFGGLGYRRDGANRRSPVLCSECPPTPDLRGRQTKEHRLLCGVLLVIRVRFSSAARSIGAMSDVNFVKVFAKAIERLRRGEIACLELVGFAQATPERRSLAQGLVEDHRHALG